MLELFESGRAAVQRELHRIANYKRQHGLWVAVGVAAGAMSLSALALAVAPLMANRAEIQQRWLVESMPELDLAQQLEAQAASGQTFHKTMVLRGPEVVAAVLRRAGVLDARATAALQAHEPLSKALQQRGARLIEVKTTHEGRLQGVVLRSSPEASHGTHFDRLSVGFDADGKPLSSLQTLPLQRTPRLASATVNSSLFAATDAADLPETVAQQLANLFTADIDFHRELRKGDSFSLVYEALTADGQTVPWDQGAGRILAAEFHNGPRVHQAYWFQAPGEAEGQYYDAQGRTRKRAFLASPLEFSRVSSGFAMRLHPVLQEWRAHRGVDYAAPTGTSVRTVGDGVVEFSGWQAGYGKTVEVRHSQDRSTLYAHLSRVDVKVGQRMAQGDSIGAVGSTGMSTGPHLHFEFRVAGAHQDPLQLARQADQKVLSASALAGFGALSQQRTTMLGLAASMAREHGTPRFE